MANYTVLSSLEETKNEVRDLHHIIAVQAVQIERNQQILYNLLGGLFNENQERALEKHIAILLGRRQQDEEEDEDDDESDPWPTTRQGDIHEQRLRVLEEKFRERDAKMTLLEEKYRIMEAQIEAMEKRQIEKFGFNM